MSVNKGDWDKSKGFEKDNDNDFNRNWLKAGIDRVEEFLKMSIARKLEIEDRRTVSEFRRRIDCQSGLDFQAKHRYSSKDSRHLVEGVLVFFMDSFTFAPSIKR